MTRYKAEVAAGIVRHARNIANIVDIIAEPATAELEKFFEESL